MNKPTIIGLGLVAVGALAVFAATRLSQDHQALTSRSPGERFVTSLSENQKASALSLVGKDSDLHRLIGDRRYQPKELVAWVTLDGEHLIGASVQLELSKPVSPGRSSWPIMIPAALGSPHLPKREYLMRTARLTVRNMSAVVASVDLRKSAVVGLAPEGPQLEIKNVKLHGPPPGPGFREPEGY